MAESWKGPTAVLGVLTILITIGIFIYQEYKSTGGAIQPYIDTSEVSVDTSRLTLGDYTANVSYYENRLDAITRAIEKYKDSFEVKSTYIRKTNIYTQFLESELANPELDTTLRTRFGFNLDSAKTVSIWENADTFRYQVMKQEFLNLHKKISDSLRRYREYYKIQ